jgi:hypothetical protein
MKPVQPPEDSLATFEPRLDTLPPAQKLLWPELSATPEEFTLYGGTAIALRLGHRASVDFDFFGAESFRPNELLQKIPYLKGATVRRSTSDTLTVTVERGEPVQVSFFGGINHGQVEAVERADGPKIKVASLVDLAGYKVSVVQQRIELKDYLDVHTLLTKANIPLAKMLAAGKVIYGKQFNPLIALKALAYHEDRALTDLSPQARRDLIDAIQQTDPRRLPELTVVKEAPQSA